MSHPLAGRMSDVSVIAESLLSQPALFPADTSGGASPAALAIAKPRGQYSGERITQDEPRCLLVGALRALGLSDRRISEMAGVSRESIPAILLHLEARGQIQPLKDRLTGWVGLLAEESAMASRDLVAAIRAGDRSEGVTQALRALGPMLGIAVEKTQLLTGQATEIVETREGARRVELDAWATEKWASVEVQSSPSESGSGAAVAVPAQSGAISGPQSEVQSVEVGAEVGAAGPEAPAAVAAEVAEVWGGGPRRAGGAMEVDGSRGMQNS